MLKRPTVTLEKVGTLFINYIITFKGIVQLIFLNSYILCLATAAAVYCGKIKVRLVYLLLKEYFLREGWY